MTIENLTRNDEVAAVVLKTMDYSKFDLHKLNREVCENQTKVIEKSIKEFKDYADDTPILVTMYHDKFIILDGQHRFKTRQKMGLPLFYKIANHVKIDDVPNLNGTNKKWGLDDYVNSYAKNGNKNYIQLLEFLQKFPKLSVKSATRIMGYHDRGSQLSSKDSLCNANIRAELFVYPTGNSHVLNATRVCELAPFFIKKNASCHRDLVSAYMSHLKPTNMYDHDTMLRALDTELKNSGTNLLHLPKGTVAVATALNNIYRKHTRGSNRIMFDGIHTL